jgi:DNA-binding LacI/PurR family transcriptional regulator
VAREAGVVAMTASRAINRSGYVSEDVRKRVLKAVEKLQYRPNVLARQLKGRRLNAMGVMLPDIANPFSSVLLDGIKDVLDAAGYTAFLATGGRGVEQERAGLESFVDHRVDGLIVATRGTSIGDKALRELATQGIPIVTIGRPMPGVRVDCIAADHYQGAFDAVTHLVKLGHRRVGFIGISPADAHTLRRHQGYTAALEAARVPVREQYTCGPAQAPSFATQEDGFESMTRLMKLKDRPTAVFARNDFAAIGALRAAHAMGLRVPEDVAVAGFDDIPIAAYTTPPLTTVRQPIREQGRLAAEFLLERAEGKRRGEFRTQVMSCELVVRESTVALK